MGTRAPILVEAEATRDGHWDFVHRQFAPGDIQMNILRYDLVDLRLLINIVETGSVTSGASRSNMSVGAASMRMKRLEYVVGTKLLTRASRGVSPTLAGSTLYSHALVLFQHLECLHGAMQPFGEGLEGTLRIFANTTAITEFLPPVLGSFLATHANVDVDLEERLSTEIAKAVLAGVADIGILAGAAAIEGLELLPYHKDRLVLAVPSGHQLDKKKPIAFADLLEFGFVSLPRGSTISLFLDNIVRELGRDMKIRMMVSSFDALCRMIEANAGIGILPESAARRLARAHRISIRKLSDEWTERTLKICARDLKALPSFGRELVYLLVQSALPSGSPRTAED